MGEKPTAGKRPMRGRLPSIVFLLSCSALLFLLLDSRRSVSANNDAFLQILAAEGIREGKGYGFSVGDQFVSIGERAPQTRWPPGLTLIAAVLESFSLRPLEWLSAATPWIGVLSLLLLTYQLIIGLGLRVVEATVVALAVLGTGAFFDWHGEVGSEAAFLLVLLSTMAAAGANKSQPTAWTVLLVWALTLLRSAGVYLAAGLAVLYGADGRKPLLGFVLKSGAAFAVFAAPLLAFHLYYGLNGGHLSNPHTGVGEQVVGQIFLLHETIAPHTTFMKSHREAGVILGGGVLSAVLIFAWCAFRLYGTGFNLVMMSAVMGVSYLALLTASAVAVGYDWASVYRVSAVSLMLITIAFWTGALTCARSLMTRRIVLAAAIVVGAAKFGFAVLRHPNPAYQSDYRTTVAAFRVYERSLGPGPVALCASDSFERNISYGLMYAAKHGQVLPRRVLWMAFGEGAGSGECHTVNRPSGTWVKRQLIRGL